MGSRAPGTTDAGGIEPTLHSKRRDHDVETRAVAESCVDQCSSDSLVAHDRDRLANRGRRRSSDVCLVGRARLRASSRCLIPRPRAEHPSKAPFALLTGRWLTRPSTTWIDEKCTRLKSPLRWINPLAGGCKRACGGRARSPTRSNSRISASTGRDARRNRGWQRFFRGRRPRIEDGSLFFAAGAHESRMAALFGHEARQQCGLRRVLRRLAPEKRRNQRFDGAGRSLFRKTGRFAGAGRSENAAIPVETVDSGPRHASHSFTRTSLGRC